MVRFEHPEAKSPMRPDAGTQPGFKKKKQPVTYRYDSSLSPALDWDGQNSAREQGEAEIARIEELSRRVNRELSRGLTPIDADRERIQVSFRTDGHDGLDRRPDREV